MDLLFEQQFPLGPTLIAYPDDLEVTIPTDSRASRANPLLEELSEQVQAGILDEVEECSIDLLSTSCILRQRKVDFLLTSAQLARVSLSSDMQVL